MPVPYGHRFPIPFDEMYPQGVVILGEIEAMTEYQSREDKAKGRPVRPMIDERTGLRCFKCLFTDPSATRDAEKSAQVVITAEVQPVPPAGTEVAPGVVVRPAVFEGLTVQPRIEGTGEFKRLGYRVFATGISAPNQRATSRPTPSSPPSPSGAGESGKAVA